MLASLRTQNFPLKINTYYYFTITEHYAAAFALNTQIMVKIRENCNSLWYGQIACVQKMLLPKCGFGITNTRVTLFNLISHFVGQCQCWLNLTDVNLQRLTHWSVWPSAYLINPSLIYTVWSIFFLQLLGEWLIGVLDQWLTIAMSWQLHTVWWIWWMIWRCK